MSSIGGIGGGITIGDIKGLDLETAMMAIQSQRAELLETQLKGQMESLSDRNKEISHLNDLMVRLKAAKNKDDPVNKAADPAVMKDILKEANAAGFHGVDSQNPNKYDVTTDVILNDGTKIRVDDAGKKEAEDYKAKNWAFRSSDYSGKKGVKEIKENIPEMKGGDIDTLYEQLKGKVDTLNNTQQTDMLRMQSLTNKRNEAFDIMTNFIKKMADSRSSVLGNMR